MVEIDEESLRETPETPEQREAKRKLEELRRTFVGPHDADAPHLRRWRLMCQEARAAGCAAALFAGFDLDPRARRDPEDPESRLLIRYDPRARVVFAIEPSPHVARQRRAVVRAVPRTVEEALAPVRAAFGVRAAEILRFIRK